MDKYAGDEIMALFGAKVASEMDTHRSISCGIDMLDKLEKFNIEYSGGKTGNYIFINPYSGEVMGDHKQGPHNFFDFRILWAGVL